ncbi:MAG TPA: ACT domain-containing protein [Acidimicrobiales bacterium]|nr:ACT domain-containing protein [Acidimicrobiales bacterium]
MVSYVLRVWLPDRPGALGAVASRIGAVRGDVVGIEILERGGGRAIDELVVELPDDSLLPLLLAEMREVEGVDVEDAHLLQDGPRDARVDALETVGMLLEATTVQRLLDALADHACRDFEADWAVVLARGTSRLPVSVVGAPPPGAWLSAFVAGNRWSSAAESGHEGPDDVAWSPLRSADLALVVGRSRRAFRVRERRQLAALARVADRRTAELSTYDQVFGPCASGRG